jgi:hypothetical protein
MVPSGDPADVRASSLSLRKVQFVFNIGQRTAVAGAFKLAGYEGPLLTAPVTSEDERIFLLAPEALSALRDQRTLEQLLQQILGRKVWVAESTAQWGTPVPFE